MTQTSTPSVTRIALASFIGTAIEFYDFYIYGMAAALIIGPVFFPGGNPATQALSSFLTFSVAFLTRPLGAALFGHFGDRIGRKTTLVASLLVMGISTTLIGVLPGYDAIGAWAPALLCLLRFGQGIGLGGEWGGAALLATENAPTGKRGWYGMFPQLGPPVGFLLATGSFLLLAHFLSEQEFKDWGWRIPFLASSVLVMIGLYVRLALAETPVFAKVLQQHQQVGLPLKEILKSHAAPLALGAMAMVVCYALFYISTVFSLSYGTTTLQIPRQQFLGMLCVAVLFMAAATPLSAWAGRSFRTATRFAGRRKLGIPVRFPIKADAGKRLTVDDYRLPVIGAIPDGGHFRADGSLAAGAVSLQGTLYRSGNRLQLRRHTGRFVCTLYRAKAGHRGRAGLGRRLCLIGCGYQFACCILDA